MRDRHLYLLRHAKSSWDDATLDDRERPLGGRGRKAARLISQRLRNDGVSPELVLCSPARRTQETLERVDPTGERVIEDGLYTATAGSLIERLNRVPDEVNSVMLIGHNPALQQLVLALSGPNDAVEAKFPTGALATLELDCSWSELEPGRARLTGLLRPKDLD
jgi:phosphohistidine phosphatase